MLKLQNKTSCSCSEISPNCGLSVDQHNVVKLCLRYKLAPGRGGARSEEDENLKISTLLENLSQNGKELANHLQDVHFASACNGKMNVQNEDKIVLDLSGFPAILENFRNRDGWSLCDPAFVILLKTWGEAIEAAETHKKKCKKGKKWFLKTIESCQVTIAKIIALSKDSTLCYTKAPCGVEGKLVSFLRTF